MSPTSDSQPPKLSMPTVYGIEVYVNSNGDISIAQDNPMDTDATVISISVDRVDLLCQFLQRAKAEAVKLERDG